MKLRRDLSTEENRKFWSEAVKVAREVEQWPSWKKGWCATPVTVSAQEPSENPSSKDPSTPR